MYHHCLADSLWRKYNIFDEIIENTYMKKVIYICYFSRFLIFVNLFKNINYTTVFRVN